MTGIKRGDDGTSATKVRKALVSGDIKEFMKLTGYKQDMWKYMRDMLRKNKVLEALRETGKSIIEQANNWMDKHND